MQSVEYSAHQILMHLLGAIYKDPLTNSVVGIDIVHHEVHEGHAFTASYKTPDASPIADNAALVVLVKAGAIYNPHIWIDASCGGEAELEIFEGPDVTADGTPMPAYNMFRGHANTAGTTVFHTPTIGVGGNGTRLLDILVPGGAKKDAPGGVIRQEMEWVFNKSVNYLIVLTNRSGANQQASTETQWYEHI